MDIWCSFVYVLLCTCAIPQMQLAKLEAKIRQESSQNGRSLPEDQLASYLMGQFEEAMKAIESQVYAKFQTTEDEVKVATEYFEEEEDKDVANAVTKLQELYRVMTGGGFSDVEVPADLTLTKVMQQPICFMSHFANCTDEHTYGLYDVQFIAIMQETMESLNVAMEEVCLEVKELDSENKEEAINERYVMLLFVRVSLLTFVVLRCSCYKILTLSETVEIGCHAMLPITDM